MTPGRDGVSSKWKKKNLFLAFVHNTCRSITCVYAYRSKLGQSECVITPVSVLLLQYENAKCLFDINMCLF